MLLSELDYELPASSIAQRPLEERDASRMLLVDRASGAWRDAQFNEFPHILNDGDLVVVNNARVMPARLFGRRAGQRAEPPGANNPELSKFLSSPIEVMLVRPLGPGMWEALVRPGRKVPVGERILFGEGELEAIVEGRGEFGLRVLRFTSKEDFTTVVGRLGHIPLPPYIKRSDDARDRERYQTVFARHGNAFAAPTAGLHFSKRILEELEPRGVKIAEITLEVGLGTFEPRKFVEGVSPCGGQRVSVLQLWRLHVHSLAPERGKGGSAVTTLRCANETRNVNSPARTACLRPEAGACIWPFQFRPLSAWK